MDSKLDNLLLRFAEGVQGGLGFFDILQVDDPEPIETEARDGFFPYTNGGYVVLAWGDFMSASSSGSIPNGINQMLERSLETCRTDFMAEHDDVDPWELEDDDPLHEEFCDYEDAYLSEGTTYFYKARAIFYKGDNRYGETDLYGVDHVYFDAYLNVDLEYGRDYIAWAGGDQTRGNWKRAIKADKLTERVIDALVKEAVAALAKV